MSAELGSREQNPCQDCENNCCERFVLFWSRREIDELMKRFPFLQLEEEKLCLVHGHETIGFVFNCERLMEDKKCQDYPLNRPSFCEKTGIVSRPSQNCKFNDQVRRKND